MQATSLGRCQADALEHLAKSEIERVAAGWIVIAQPSKPIIPHMTMRSLVNRGLCRLSWHSGRERARITRGGRKAWNEIEIARATIRSAA